MVQRKLLTAARAAAIALFWTAPSIHTVSADLMSRMPAEVYTAGAGHRTASTSTTYKTREGVEFFWAPQPKWPRVMHDPHGPAVLRGAVRLELDQKTGAVTHVTVTQSTGYSDADRRMIEAFSEWRARTPLKVKEVAFPVQFKHPD